MRWQSGYDYSSFTNPQVSQLVPPRQHPLSNQKPDEEDKDTFGLVLEESWEGQEDLVEQTNIFLELTDSDISSTNSSFTNNFINNNSFLQDMLTAG